MGRTVALSVGCARLLETLAFRFLANDKIEHEMQAHVEGYHIRGRRR